MREQDVLIVDARVLDEERAIPMHDFCAACGILEALVVEMVSEGILEPSGTFPREWLFSTACLSRAHRALRLRRDLEMNWPAIAVVLPLLDELQDLRRHQHGWQRWSLRFER